MKKSVREKGSGATIVAAMSELIAYRPLYFIIGDHVRWIASSARPDLPDGRDSQGIVTVVTIGADRLAETVRYRVRFSFGFFTLLAEQLALDPNFDYDMCSVNDFEMENGSSVR